MPVIFISYRRTDSQDVTGRIYDRLIAKFTQQQVYKDVDNIPLGVSFPMHIKQLLTKANVVLVIIGPNWVNATDEHGRRRLDDPNDYVRLEVEIALKANMPVVPVLVSNAKMPQASELPPSMRKLVERNGTAVRPDPDFNNDMARLFTGIDHLERMLAGKTANPDGIKKGEPPSAIPVDEAQKADRRPMDAGEIAEHLGRLTSKPEVQAPVPVALPAPPRKADPPKPRLPPPEVVVKESLPVLPAPAKIDRETTPPPAKPKAPAPEHAHEPGKTGGWLGPMLLALMVALTFSVLCGFGFWFFNSPSKDGGGALKGTPLPFPATPKLGDVISNPLGMKFAWVPPGKSWLGGGGGKPGTTPFTLEAGLWCGIYPVTQAEWQEIMGDNPSDFKDNPRCPVEMVSWNGVQKYLKKLNSRGGNCSYRLPTEQEWEYICRGGPISQEQSKYDYYFATSKTDLTPKPTNELSYRLPKVFDQLEKPSEVGSYGPNPLGIFDMHGSVWQYTSSVSEWSKDGSGHVSRGGTWCSPAEGCTASFRSWQVSHASHNFEGFRVLAVPMGK